jgi:platelet-activating factor acetylhydrolase
MAFSCIPYVSSDLLTSSNVVDSCSVRSIHTSFSDYPILLPKRFQKGSPHKITQVITDMAIAFLDDRMDESISKLNTRKMEIEEIETGSKTPPKKQLVGELGDIIVH